MACLLDLQKVRRGIDQVPKDEGHTPDVSQAFRHRQPHFQSEAEAVIQYLNQTIALRNGMVAGADARLMAGARYWLSDAMTLDAR
ncbi:hypothetical protein [Jeongeupia sp. HS-3]|uniref:hypothetical protein n=1 Tax=Jeongeupia sp. HS-3 TaxID=1009682 RepID=UPI0019105D7B|nr:hypothetical protein [Jeongeupia sp. HS-3]